MGKPLGTRRKRRKKASRGRAARSKQQAVEGAYRNKGKRSARLHAPRTSLLTVALGSVSRQLAKPPTLTDRGSNRPPGLTGPRLPSHGQGCARFGVPAALACVWGLSARAAPKESPRCSGAREPAERRGRWSAAEACFPGPLSRRPHVGKPSGSQWRPLPAQRNEGPRALAAFRM
jgi:hypothetical protein